jgi:hypothetical protein
MMMCSSLSLSISISLSTSPSPPLPRSCFTVLESDDDALRLDIQEMQSKRRLQYNGDGQARTLLRLLLTV